MNGQQALSISQGFAKQTRKSKYSVWACSILPQHTHLVIGRHHYRAEQIVNLLKGAATRELIGDANHPLQRFATIDRRPPAMWAAHQWISYLDSEQAIEDAIAYVVENPIKEGKPRQSWNWILPFQGIETGWTTYH